MIGFRPQITGIKGLTDKRRFPRLNKIRLGFKIRKGDKEYPAELPFFLLPLDVARIYGGKVTVNRAKELGVTRKDVLFFIEQNIHRLAEELEIMLPVNEPDAVFPTALKWYGSQKGAVCMGNGEVANRFKGAMDETAKITEAGKENLEAGDRYIEIECPCPKLKTDANPQGPCTSRGHLMMLIPKVNMGGVYQLDVGSYNSIIDLMSGMDYIQSLVGRFNMVPLTLRRIPTITHHDDKKQIHFTLQLLLHVPIEHLEELRKDNARILQHAQYALPAPEDVNPALDTEGPIIDVPAETAEAPVAETEEPESAEEMPMTYEDRMERCKTLEELQAVWKEIVNDEAILKKDKESNARRLKLNNLMKKKKDALTKAEAEKPTGKSPEEMVADFKVALQSATTVEELDRLVGDIVRAGIKGEDYTTLIRERDKRSVQIKEGKLI